MARNAPASSHDRRAALSLASGARDAGELRDWLHMTGLLPEPPAKAAAAPGSPVAVTEKPCTKCGATKPASEFYRRAQARDRLDSTCKTCRTGYHRDYMASHPQARQTERDRSRDRARHRRGKQGRKAATPPPPQVAALLGAEADALGVPVADLLRAMAGTAA
jgi:hypothetical protein